MQDIAGIKASIQRLVTVSDSASAGAAELEADVKRGFEAAGSSKVLESIPDGKRSWVRVHAGIVPNYCGFEDSYAHDPSARIHVNGNKASLIFEGECLNKRGWPAGTVGGAMDESEFIQYAKKKNPQILGTFKAALDAATVDVNRFMASAVEGSGVK